MSWWTWGRENRSFNVMIYEEDYKELCAWVLKKPNIETGGDLFGLWADKHTAVIQLVLGPGKKCTRTTASFYQDIDYLRRVGSYLTQNEGVCHIGEWHSHHQLGLAQPSGGDENTVWNNMPTYNLKRFVIFIANIHSSKHSYNVNVGCFLFEIDDQGKHLDVLQGEFTILQKKSPFSGKLSRETNNGAEEDDENKIAIKDLQLEVNAAGKSPSVTYMKPKRRKFEVVIYENDYKELCAWVLKKPNIETGGDLFGLWADKHTAVIQLVLGPGQACTRSSVSFYQDVKYLESVGSYLTQNEGVCHIGEWHSHHQLGLARPSGGDERTVWNNMPTYNLKRFVIFIANIQSSKHSYNVNVGCFLFEINDQGKHLDVLPGEFTILEKNSPLSWKKQVSEKRNKGAEKEDENKIAIKDLKMEVKEGGRSPSVRYLKPIPAPKSKRMRGNSNHAQPSGAKADQWRRNESGDRKPRADPKEELQRQLREMEQQLTNLQHQVTTLKAQLTAKDQEVNELKITLSTAQQQALVKHQRQQIPDWVISRDQIQLTNKSLGSGGWGSVVEGKYCGCTIAVKQIHELIISPLYKTLFEREMDIASRCRHPCLLQFLGATNDDGSPLFVTELMESSLRALLEQRLLSEAEVSTISLDVALALNYLHQKKPSPIIHRDISSANVLLWRQNDQWRGKVSDYGTANFMQHTMTVAPGAWIYSAPEALTSKQTVKVDVYSFGVLLCEMCIRDLPDPERRDQQIAMMTNGVLRALTRRCLQSEPEGRPSMEEIIEKLKEPV